MQGSIASEGLCCLADVGSRRRNLLIPSPFILKQKGWNKAVLGGFSSPGHFRLADGQLP